VEDTYGTQNGTQNDEQWALGISRTKMHTLAEELR